MRKNKKSNDKIEEDDRMIYKIIESKHLYVCAIHVNEFFFPNLYSLMTYTYRIFFFVIVWMKWKNYDATIIQHSRTVIWLNRNKKYLQEAILKQINTRNIHWKFMTIYIYDNKNTNTYNNNNIRNNRKTKPNPKLSGLDVILCVCVCVWVSVYIINIPKHTHTHHLEMEMRIVDSGNCCHCLLVCFFYFYFFSTLQIWWQFLFRLIVIL